MHREVLTDDTAFLFLFIRIIFWLQRKLSLLFQLEYFLEQLIDIYIVFGGRFQVSNFPHFLQQCNIILGTSTNNRHVTPPRAPRRSWWRPGACPPPRRTCCRPAARASPPDSPSPAHTSIISSGTLLVTSECGSRKTWGKQLSMLHLRQKILYGAIEILLRKMQNKIHVSMLWYFVDNNTVQ